jgi:hypothetical protein
MTFAEFKIKYDIRIADEDKDVIIIHKNDMMGASRFYGRIAIWTLEDYECSFVDDYLWLQKKYGACIRRGIGK